MNRLLEPKSHAVAILQNAIARVVYSGEPGSEMKVNALYNAAQYLLYGKIEASRGVAHLWANWPAVSLPNPMQVAESAVVAESRDDDESDDRNYIESAYGYPEAGQTREVK